MESIPKNTVPLERQIFLSKLKSNPLFLLLHLQSLFAIIWKKYRIHILKPSRLLSSVLKKNNATEIGCDHLQTLMDRIPERALPPKNFPEIAKENSLFDIEDPAQENSFYDISDPEDYLAKHRWGNLLDPLWSENFHPILQKDLPPAIQAWLDYPPLTSDPAWETYSVCERVANLLTWLSFFPKSKRNTLSPKILSFLQFSLSWIIHHLEFHGRDTNNHILNNARALIMGGVVTQNESAVLRGVHILKKMLPVLIQANGFLRERSSHYQLIVLTWLLDSLSFLKISQIAHFSEIRFLEEILDRVRESAALCCDERGYLLANIGDISPDISPAKTSARLLVCYPKDWPYIGLSQKNRSDDWYVLNAHQQTVMLNFPSGKFPPRYPTHAHSDLTSFVWRYQNEPILIDPGRSRYTKDAISSLQKSALGHNVVLVDDVAPLCESLVERGNWWPTPYAKANTQVSCSENHIVLKHNGYQRATPVKQHQRKILLFKDGLIAEDFFTGSGEVNLKFLWHLNPAFKIFSEIKKIISNGKINLTIEISPLNFPINYLNHHAQLGWHSSSYGIAYPHPVLFHQQKVSLPFKNKVVFRVEKCVE